MMEQTLKDQLKEARKASHALNRVSEEQIDRVLMNLADAVEKHMETILQICPEWIRLTPNTTVSG